VAVLLTLCGIQNNQLLLWSMKLVDVRAVIPLPLSGRRWDNLDCNAARTEGIGRRVRVQEGNTPILARSRWPDSRYNRCCCGVQRVADIE
jgi:hypothetical protein